MACYRKQFNLERLIEPGQGARKALALTNRIAATGLLILAPELSETQPRHSTFGLATKLHHVGKLGEFTALRTSRI